MILSLDATGFSRRNPSYHYLNRIHGTMPKIPIKLSAAFDVQKRKFCAARVRVLPAHDIKDVKSLLTKCSAHILVADKAYDADWVHHLCYKKKIIPHIPIREYGKSRHKNMTKRRIAARLLDKDLYHQRELIESGFGSVKRKFRSTVLSKKIQTIKSDLYGRLICYNLFYGFY
jgi:hypothetical protein